MTISPHFVTLIWRLHLAERCKPSSRARPSSRTLCSDWDEMITVRWWKWFDQYQGKVCCMLRRKKNNCRKGQTPLFPDTVEAAWDCLLHIHLLKVRFIKMATTFLKEKWKWQLWLSLGKDRNASWEVLNDHDVGCRSYGFMPGILTFCRWKQWYFECFHEHILPDILLQGCNRPSRSSRLPQPGKTRWHRVAINIIGSWSHWRRPTFQEPDLKNLTIKPSLPYRFSLALIHPIPKWWDFHMFRGQYESS